MSSRFYLFVFTSFSFALSFPAYASGDPMVVYGLGLESLVWFGLVIYALRSRWSRSRRFQALGGMVCGLIVWFVLLNMQREPSISTLVNVASIACVVITALGTIFWLKADG